MLLKYFGKDNRSGFSGISNLLSLILQMFSACIYIGINKAVSSK